MPQRAPAEHGPVAAPALGPQKAVERLLEHSGHLADLRGPGRRRRRDSHEGCNIKAGAGGVARQGGDDVGPGQIEADFLRCLAPGGVEQIGVFGLCPAAGKGNLTGVFGQVRRALGQHQTNAVFVLEQNQHDGAGLPLRLGAIGDQIITAPRRQVSFGKAPGGNRLSQRGGVEDGRHGPAAHGGLAGCKAAIEKATPPDQISSGPSSPLGTARSTSW